MNRIKDILKAAYGEGLVKDNSFKIKEGEEDIFYYVKKPYFIDKKRFIFQKNNMNFSEFEESAKKNKAFLFFEIDGDIPCGNNNLNDYIYSIEIADGIGEVKETLTLFYIKNIEDKFKCDDKIIRLNIGKDEETKFYIVAISIKDEEAIGYPTLKNYIVSSDNRTYNKVVRNLTSVEYVHKKEMGNQDKDNNNPYNMLVYGAPGTGKSYLLDELVEKELEKFDAQIKASNEELSKTKDDLDNIKEFKRQYVKRITFYEDYSYENFVGCYKAKPNDEESEINVNYNNAQIKGTICERKITYSYEPGPFIEMYKKAKNDLEHNYFIFIEEINRAKAASVFGDMFQLLDRENGESKYDITPEPSLREYLKENINECNNLNVEDITMSIPNNLYIWATMNSADQGVFTLDSAFKRRWEFRYKDIVGYERGANIYLVHDGTPQYINWDVFRTAINNKILEYGLDEDRCIGPYYFSDGELEKIKKYTLEKNEVNKRDMVNPLVDKLLAYLKQDVFRMDDAEIFKSDNDKKCNMSALRRRVFNGDSIEDILNIDIASVEADETLKKWKEVDESAKVSDISNDTAEDVTLSIDSKKEDTDE